MNRVIAVACFLFAAVALLWWTPAADARSSYFTGQGCSGCHGSTVTCNGCHQHGAHSSLNGPINITGVTNKTSYAPGETISVTITGGWQSGWIRAILYDQNMNELGRSTGPTGMGGGAGYPITLTAPAPAAPGTYTWNVSWYGNYVYNPGPFQTACSASVVTNCWKPSSNPNHGEEIVATNSFTVASLAAPAISVTDSVTPANDLLVPFGSVYAGSTASQTVTVTNTGTASLLVGAVGSANPLAAPFSITNNTCSNQTIAPSASCTLTVAFAPTAAGSFSDSFNIPSNDPTNSTVTVNVSGTGAIAPTPAITVTDSVAPATDLMVPFGSVNAGSTASQTVTVTNTGTASLLVGAVGSANPLAAPFSITNNTCSNQTIAPSASCTLTVAFAPTAAGSFSDSFSIPSNDPLKSTVTVNVSGTGAIAPTPAITVTDSVAPATDLMVPFGSVIIGSSAAQTVTVTNSGTADLQVGAVGSANTLAAPFSITNDTCSNRSLTPSASCTITLGFAPAAAGTASDSFNIPSNDPTKASVTMNVSGTGSMAPAPAISVTDSVAPTNDLLVPFGTLTTGGSASQTVTVTNSGNAALLIGMIGSVDALAAPFSLTADNCSNQTIASAASCSLTVSFAPTATGTFTDGFNIPSNDPAKPSTTVSVSGTGSATTVGRIKVSDSVYPADDLQIPFGSVREGRSVDQYVRITNTTDGALMIGTIASANPLAAPFSITSDNCSGKTLSGVSTCVLTVRFSPPTGCAGSSGGSDNTRYSSGSACAYSDSFDIPSNDADNPSITVQVSGSGASSYYNNPPDRPHLRHPADHEDDLETSLDMSWDAVTDPDGDHVSYELHISTDPSFSTEATVTRTAVNTGARSGGLFAGSGLGLIFLGFAFAGTARGRKAMMLIATLAVIAGGSLVGCSSGNTKAGAFGGSTPASTAVTQHVSGLHTSTTYYWKVVAKDGNGGVAESDTNTFNTK